MFARLRDACARARQQEARSGPGQPAGVSTVWRHVRGKWACANCQTLIQAFAIGLGCRRVMQTITGSARRVVTSRPAAGAVTIGNDRHQIV
ncbi:hypothetical protein EJO68_30960 [Variovorax atrisoli]|nr:hypothetical protein EJO68_30960 [Variovorax sp. 369]